MTTILPAATPISFADIVDWLSSDECRQLDNQSFVAGLGEILCKAGLPIDRLAFHIRLPHPELVGHSCAWAPGEAVEVKLRRHGFLESAAFLGSPLRRVMETGQSFHTRHDGRDGVAWTHIDIFQGRGLVEHFIAYLGNREGPSAASFCTASPGGFSNLHRNMIERILPLLQSSVELRVLRQAEAILLDTYVGSATARRILGGNIRRGQVETLEAALLLCDLRGFTELSNRLPGARILQLLDIYFDRVVPAITQAGGEVLKFMGDAVMAYFAHDDARIAAAAAGEAALSALSRLAEIELPDARLQAGIALHYGEVSYGNIGSEQRLDFTVIGRDVNLLSRIQDACSTMGQPLLMSKRFADLLGRRETRPIGRRKLKGFTESIELHALHSPETKVLKQQIDSAGSSPRNGSPAADPGKLAVA
ncbi:MAG: adenylate/guanylate cyclase domain-containing protein [Rhodospirillaceae bacterium]|nr:MAG: adenylate/guanylate cyclase domain-containing protein [Rhodospirillaceae bacterium]